MMSLASTLVLLWVLISVLNAEVRAVEFPWLCLIKNFTADYILHNKGPREFLIWMGRLGWHVRTERFVQKVQSSNLSYFSFHDLADFADLGGQKTLLEKTLLEKAVEGSLTVSSWEQCRETALSDLGVVRLRHEDIVSSTCWHSIVSFYCQRVAQFGGILEMPYVSKPVISGRLGRRIVDEQPVQLQKSGIAFLIVMVKRLQHVQRLVSRLQSPLNSFLIHLDTKAASVLPALQTWSAKFNNVQAFSETEVARAGPSLLKVYVKGIARLLDMCNSWDFVIMLSETCYPVRPVDSLAHFLYLRRGFNFIFGSPMKSCNLWHSAGFLTHECDGHAYDLVPHAIVADYHPNVTAHDHFYNWEYVALSRAFATEIANGLHEGLQEVLSWFHTPHERFWQEAIRRSVQFSSTQVQASLHYIEMQQEAWTVSVEESEHGPMHAAPLTPESLTRSFRKQAAFFARKFDDSNLDAMDVVDSFMDTAVSFSSRTLDPGVNPLLQCLRNLHPGGPGTIVSGKIRMLWLPLEVMPEQRWIVPERLQIQYEDGRFEEFEAKVSLASSAALVTVRLGDDPGNMQENGKEHLGFRYSKSLPSVFSLSSVSDATAMAFWHTDAVAFSGVDVGSSAFVASWGSEIGELCRQEFMLGFPQWSVADKTVSFHKLSDATCRTFPALDSAQTWWFRISLKDEVLISKPFLVLPDIQDSCGDIQAHFFRVEGPGRRQEL